MARLHAPQTGMSLVELLVSLPIAVMLLAPLVQLVRSGLDMQRVAAEQQDVAQQARFAMQRMLAAVRATAPKALASKPPGTTGDWLSPAAFCLNGNAQLIETIPADTSCAGTRVIGERVTTFAVQTYNAGTRAKTVIEISLTVTGPTGQGVPLLARARMGGAEL